MAGKKSAVYGELQRRDGSGMPVAVVESATVMDKAGYEPEKLDPLIASLIKNSEVGSMLLLRYTPILATLMEKLQVELAATLRNLAPPPPANGEAPPPGIPQGFSDALLIAENVSRILERLNKMMMQSVSAKDQATRLRTFLATGDVEDGGLQALGEQQLRKLVLDAASGWQPPSEEPPRG